MRTLLCRLTACAALILSATLGQAQTAEPDRPLWMRSPVISLDASTIAFTYRGQIWIVPTTGREATALTERTYRSTHPIWTPDSQQIVFASDRYNAGDLFKVPLDGAEILRLTHHSRAEEPVAITPDGQQVLSWGAAIGSPMGKEMDALMFVAEGQRFAKPRGGGRETSMASLPIHQASVSPDGKLISCSSQPSIEVEWRKGQVSDATSNIWILDRAAGTHRQMTTSRSNEGYPVFSPDGACVYFVAEMPATGAADPEAKPASYNVWRQKTSGPEPAEQITFYTTMPVRGLSVALDGTLVYGPGGERAQPRGHPHPAGRAAC